MFPVEVRAFQKDKVNNYRNDRLYVLSSDERQV